MATITKVGTPSLATLTTKVDAQAGLFAGEDIAAGDLLYIKAADGKLWKSNGTSANAAAKVRGIAPKAAKAGDPLTLMNNVAFRYGSGLTPGADLFASATAGAIDDAATTGGTAPIGYVIDATRIHIFGSRY